MTMLDSAIVMLLLACFLLSAFCHYRTLRHPDAPPVSWPFAIGLAALLLVFLFLLGSGFLPGWTWRRQAFLVIAPAMFGGALAYFLRQRARLST